MHSTSISLCDYHYSPLQNAMAANYTQPPPAYGSTNKLVAEEEAQQPLLQSQAHAGPSSAGFGAYYDQPSADDVPDDFKVRGLALT